MKNLLLFCYEFPPFPNVAAQRFGQMCKYMEEYGWRPWVVTTHSEGDLPVPVPETRIIRLTDNYQGTLREDNRKRKEIGWKKSVRSVLNRFNLRIKSYNPFSFGRTWQKEVLRHEDEILEKFEKPDVVLGSYNPIDSLYLARGFAKRFGVPWVADFRDLITSFDPDQNPFARALDWIILKRLVKTASLLTAVSPTHAEILTEKTGKRSEVIYNGWDRGNSSVQRNPDMPVNSPAGDYLYYAGSLKDMMLHSFGLTAATAAKTGMNFVIRSLGPRRLEEELVKSFSREDCAEKLVLLPPVTARECVTEASNAMVNIVIADTSPDSNREAMGILTGKVFELITLPPPVLAFAHPSGDLATLLEKTGKGVVCNSVDQIEKFLRNLDDNGMNFYAGKSSIIKKYSRKFQAGLLCGILNDSVQ